MLLSRKGKLDTERLLQDARRFLGPDSWNELKSLVESYAA